LITASVFVLLTAFNLTIMNVYDALRSFFAGMHHEVEYEEYEEEEVVEKEPEIRLPRRKRRIIDIPLDDVTPVENEEKEAEPDKKTGFELAEPNVKSPADVLMEAHKDETQEQEETHSEPEEEIPDSTEEVLINEENFTRDVIAAIEESEKKELEKREEVVASADGFAVPEEATEAEIREIYAYPPLSLLDPPTVEKTTSASAELQSVGIKLGETIRSFGLDIKVVNIVRGPSVTRFEVQLDAGVKLSRLTNLADDIALSLGVTGVFISPVPSKSLIGIEVPNKTVQVVNISEVIASDEFTKNESNVAFALGKDITGKCIISDIAKLPHMLIAGTTGSGKSVCVNSLIISLLYRSSPEQVRLIMVDPKVVELSIYNGIPHLLIPVVTDPKKAAGALQWAVVEMMRRYDLFAKSGVRNMEGYNKLVTKTGEADPMPNIVIVIDELSDLMTVAKKDVEASILRLTQMARAAGMHLIIATQRPSADVITGVIKANVPSRIAFAVSSKLESNIILGRAGAEALIGKGDMMYEPIGAGKATRVQGCFISSDEVEAVVNYVKQNGTAEYSQDIIDQIEKQAQQNEEGSGEGHGGVFDDGDVDEMLDAAIDVVVESGQASTSMLQRRLKLGYSRAARIIDQMEERGIVGEFEGSKPRKILITRDEWREMKMRREEM
ncbi:MAG: DNA translocase FtsK, partial [Oscillospiraceae bacterium]|nr:DNA translocase FtsK [Oscillospiraceae bacterium]